MPKEPRLEKVRKRLQTETEKIKKEYGIKIKQLEDKIEQFNREREQRIVKAEKRFRKDFCVTFESVLGEGDYRWLVKWLSENKNKEIEEAEKTQQKKRANELKQMSAEDYLFYYFNDPKLDRKLNKDIEQNKKEEIERLSFILAKLRMENVNVKRTLL